MRAAASPIRAQPAAHEEHAMRFVRPSEGHVGKAHVTAIVASVAMVTIGLGLVTACGGATSSDLFGPTQEDSPGASNGNGDGNSQGGGRPTTPNGGTDDGSGGTDPGDDEPSDDDDAGSTPDANVPRTDGGSPTRTIACGTSVCSASDVCCVTPDVGGREPRYACQAATGPGGLPSACAGARFECDSKSDCAAGEVCCASFLAQSNRYTGARCARSCEATVGTRAVEFCDPKAATSECDANERCAESRQLRNISFCERR
jgi:hypothetical protein